MEKKRKGWHGVSREPSPASDIIYSGIIGIGISLMFMLSIEGFPRTVTPFIAYTILGLVAGLFISSSYIVTKRLLSGCRAYNERLLLRIIHSYLVCTLAFFLVALVMTIFPWSVFPSLKTAFYSSMGVGIISAMICFYFEYLAIKDERLRLEEKNKELAVIEERNRIARELHDSVSQSLFGISLNLNTLELILQNQPEQAGALIRQVKEMVEEAQREMRLMIYGLQPAVLREKGSSKPRKPQNSFGSRYQLEVISAGGDERRSTTRRSWLYTGHPGGTAQHRKHARATRPRFPSPSKRRSSGQDEDNGHGLTSVRPKVPALASQG